MMYAKFANAIRGSRSISKQKVCSAVLASLLAACGGGGGGGGGGGSGSPGATAGPESLLTVARTGAATLVAYGANEFAMLTPLDIGAGRGLWRVIVPGAAQNCGISGTRQGTLTDSGIGDSIALASFGETGDELLVTYSNCVERTGGPTLNGTIRYTVNTSTGTPETDDNYDMTFVMTNVSFTTTDGTATRNGTGRLVSNRIAASGSTPAATVESLTLTGWTAQNQPIPGLGDPSLVGFSMNGTITAAFSGNVIRACSVPSGTDTLGCATFGLSFNSSNPLIMSVTTSLSTTPTSLSFSTPTRCTLRGVRTSSGNSLLGSAASPNISCFVVRERGDEIDMVYNLYGSPTREGVMGFLFAPATATTATAQAGPFYTN